MALHLIELDLERLDALADHAPVEFDLGLAGAAAVADATALPLEVAPAPHQTCREVLQTRQFHLQLAFMALRTFAEDLENQHRAVGHGHTEMTLQVALLRGRQGLIEQHHFGAFRFDQGLDFVGLSRANEECCVGRLPARDEPRNHHVTGGLGELRQFVKAGLEMASPAQVNPHQDGARRRIGAPLRKRIRGTQGTGRPPPADRQGVRTGLMVRPLGN